MDKLEKYQEKQVLEGKIFAVLSYLSILCIIPLVLKKDNPFALFHAKQGLVLFVMEVAVFIASVVLEWILRPSVFLFGILSLWGIIEALRGRDLKLPVISEIADRITL